MLGFVKGPPTCAAPQGLLPVRRGGVLLAEHSASLARIRSMVGVPAQHWQLLYEALFAAYAEYMQQIPVPKTSRSPECVTQLRRRLDAVELALKIRRGYVLPPGKEPEAVANEQDVWTYAVASAALLHGTGDTLRDQQVTLYDRYRKPSGVWSPWTGSMIRSGNLYYRVAHRTGAASDLGHTALPLLVPHLVPQHGLRWLAAHDDALSAWLATITAQAPEGTAMADIIRRASQALDPESVLERCAGESEQSDSSDSSGSVVGEHRVQAPEAAAPSESCVPEASADGFAESGAEAEGQKTLPAPNNRADDSGESFLQWLIDGMASGVLAVNSAKAHLHVVDAGLLLASPAVFRAFAGENWRDVQKHFLKRKLSAKTAGGENIFLYRHESDPGRKTIKGMLIPNPEEALGVSLPSVNPQLAPKPDRP